jgi:hypothetical protein
VGVGGARSRESGMSRPLNPKETECSDVPNKRRSQRRRSTAVAAHSADMTDTYIPHHGASVESTPSN